MRILILGGTNFLGRHLVGIARTAGHEISLFNRGRTNPDLFPELEQLRGDRDGDLSALRGRRWDAVIDTSGYVPRVVSDSAQLLANQVDHYTFVSTLSVYADFTIQGMDETAPLATIDDETVEEITGETYGPLKVLCERGVQAAYPESALIVRPGLIVGPYDPTDRFTYWPVRVQRGGDVLAPAGASRPVQFIDARDLAAWMLALIEARKTSVFNATGPDVPLTMGDFLATCRAATGSSARIVWVDGDFLLEHEVQPFVELPLWVPGEEGLGFGTFDVSKAMEAGLTFRPASETIADTVSWARQRPEDYAWRAGLKPEREEELIAAWRKLKEAP